MIFAHELVEFGLSRHVGAVVALHTCYDVLSHFIVERSDVEALGRFHYVIAIACGERLGNLTDGSGIRHAVEFGHHHAVAETAERAAATGRAGVLREACGKFGEVGSGYECIVDRVNALFHCGFAFVVHALGEKQYVACLNITFGRCNALYPNEVECYARVGHRRDFAEFGVVACFFESPRIAVGGDIAHSSAALG